MSRGKLTETEVNFGESVYTFKRALPMEGLQIFEKLRPALANASGAIKTAFKDEESVSQDARFLAAALEVVGSLPPETVSKAMALLMQHVEYSHNGSMPQKVSRDLDSAFKGRTVFEIYEIIIRAFAVNFMESFDEVLSLWGQVQGRGDMSEQET